MSEKKKKLLEVDLYKPLQKYFLKQDYEVYGEVQDCDLTAIKGEELIIVELKLSLNIDLLVQAAKRQRLTDFVYIAIPKPKTNLRSKKWNDICHLVRRLELGLILVSFPGNRAKIDILFHPTTFDRAKSKGQNKYRRSTLIKEINGRSADYNVGGSSRTKIMTAYKENCVQIACYLNQLGPLAPKTLVKMGTGDKTPSILQKNFYRWFHRVSRGIYKVTEKARQDLQEYPELVSYYTEKLKEDSIKKMDDISNIE